MQHGFSFGLLYKALDDLPCYPNPTSYSAEGVPKELKCFGWQRTSVIKRMRLKDAPVMPLACTVPGQNETSLAAVAHQLCLSLSEHLIAWALARDCWRMENKWCWVKHVRDFIRAEKSRNAWLCKLKSIRWLEYLTQAEVHYLTVSHMG